MKTRFVLTTTLIFIFSMSVFGQESHTQPVYAFEFLTYKGQAGMTFLEILAEIPTDNLQFVKFAKGFYGSYQVTFALFDSLKIKVAELSHIDSVKVKIFAEIDKWQPPQLVRFTFAVPPGTYQAEITTIDMETKAYLKYKKNLTLPDYANGLQLSSLQLATSIVTSQENTPLVKAGKLVVPNIHRVVDPNNNNILYLYTEVYNLVYADTASAPQSFTLLFNISDADGKEIKSYTNTIAKPYIWTAVHAKIPISGLSPGKYQLEVTVVDVANNHAYTTSKTIQFDLSNSADVEVTKVD